MPHNFVLLEIQQNDYHFQKVLISTKHYYLFFHSFTEENKHFQNCLFLCVSAITKVTLHLANCHFSECHFPESHVADKHSNLFPKENKTIFKNEKYFWCMSTFIRMTLYLANCHFAESNTADKALYLIYRKH